MRGALPSAFVTRAESPAQLSLFLQQAVDAPTALTLADAITARDDVRAVVFVDRDEALAEFVELLAAWPRARAFVEIKHASITAFGVEQVIAIMLETLAPVLAQCILISFEYAALQQLRRQATLPIGWVLPHWDDDNRQRARALAPDYLFVNRKRLPHTPEPLWDGPWRWAIYTVNRADEIQPFLARGFDMIETNAIRRLQAGEGGHD